MSNNCKEGDRRKLDATASVHFSSRSCEWSTPMDLFARINAEHGPFDLDVCATSDNAKCARFYSIQQDGLQQTWTGSCWCNPPYGRTIGQWVRKAWQSSLAGATVVCLLPSRTDTSWWHDYVEPFARVQFLRGRVRFSGSTSGAPFPSAVVVFSPSTTARCRRCGRPSVPARSGTKFCSTACKQGAYRARREMRVTVMPQQAGSRRADTGYELPAQQARTEG